MMKNTTHQTQRQSASTYQTKEFFISNDNAGKLSLSQRGAKLTRFYKLGASKQILLMLLGALMAGRTVQAANLISNGDLETGDLSGWIASGNVVANTFSISGSYSMAFNGGDKTPNGEVSQSFATTIGKSYTLTFKYGHNGSNKNQQLTVQLDGAGGIGSLRDDTFIAQVNTITTPDTYSFTFTADTATTTLRVKDNAANKTVSSDIIIDDVSIPSNVPIAGFGTALDFDGTDDYVSVPSGINIANQSFTFEAWAKRGSIGNRHTIVGQGVNVTNQGLQFGFVAGDQFIFAFVNNALGTSTTYTDNDWHHWAGTYNAATKIRTVYQDGIQVAQASPLASTRKRKFRYHYALSGFPENVQ